MRFIALIALLLASAAWAGALEENTKPGALPRDQTLLLTQWYENLAEPGVNETFGDYLLRAALLKWHSPYARPMERNSSELLRVDLDRFDCVSLIESSLAVASCAWRHDPTITCFIRELLATRYRDGVVSGFTSRLHYIEDWLEQSQARYRLIDETRHLGGVLLRRDFSYMTQHPFQFPAMDDPRVRKTIELTQSRLSERTYSVIVRPSLRYAAEQLQNGDLVGVVTTEPGRLISHTGLVTRNAQGVPRLLHASSHHGRVVVTATGLARYVLRRPNRWGIIVARPLAPDH